MSVCHIRVSRLPSAGRTRVHGPHAQRLFTRRALSDRDIERLIETTELSLQSVTKTQPHPNAGCILTTESGDVVGRGSLWAQGAESPEVSAALEAQGRARGGTAYLNIECGDCHGDDAAIRALITSGIQRCVVGLRHPLVHSRGVAIDALLSAGIRVDVVDTIEDDRLDILYTANEALLHRAALGKPMGVLKYAMTLDGKIAASTGHSAWVSSKDSRSIVFETRASCDAVIVGGQTVRRDNPKLTTRRDSGHQPVRIVMSRKLDLPIEAAMWDISVAPTIVATQKGVRTSMQKELVKKGVEVIEFDFLTPGVVSEYCYQRGFLACLWECGGALAAPAVADNAIHKVMAFIAPKIIGGDRAPTPMGELGFVEMTQAINVVEPHWAPVGPDLMMHGYLPTSGGPKALAKSLGLIQDGSPRLHSPVSSSMGRDGHPTWHTPSSTPVHGDKKSQKEFYKCWDSMGFLSNFSPHPISMPSGTMTRETFQKVEDVLLSSTHGTIPDSHVWPSVEHYYQAQKFSGVYGAEHLIEQIQKAASPEEAARCGRAAERATPDLVRPDWADVKCTVMHAALLRKFSCHKTLQTRLLHDVSEEILVESSPHDFFWGCGIDGTGSNHLGRLLMSVRDTLRSNTHST